MSDTTRLDWLDTLFRDGGTVVYYVGPWVKIIAPGVEPPVFATDQIPFGHCEGEGPNLREAVDGAVQKETADG